MKNLLFTCQDLSSVPTEAFFAFTFLLFYRSGHILQDLTGRRFSQEQFKDDSLPLPIHYSDFDKSKLIRFAKIYPIILHLVVLQLVMSLRLISEMCIMIFLNW